MVVKHAPPVVDLVRELVEDERVGAARALLASEPPATLRVGELASWSRVLAPPCAVPSAHRTVDRTVDYDWLSRKSDPYRGEWVAIADGTVLSHAETLRALLGSLSHEQRSRAVVHKIR